MFQLRAIQYVIFRGDRLQRSRESRADQRRHPSSPFRHYRSVFVLTSPKCLVTAPRNNVHAYIQTHTNGTSLEFISHRSRGCTHCSLSWDTRSHVTISVKFRFPPPPPCTRPSMSMFTGALSTGRDHLTRQRRVVLYQLHPANDTAQSYSRKSTGFVFFHDVFRKRNRKRDSFFSTRRYNFAL